MINYSESTNFWRLAMELKICVSRSHDRSQSYQLLGSCWREIAPNSIMSGMWFFWFMNWIRENLLQSNEKEPCLTVKTKRKDFELTVMWITGSSFVLFCFIFLINKLALFGVVTLSTESIWLLIVVAYCLHVKPTKACCNI